MGAKSLSNSLRVLLFATTAACAASPVWAQATASTTAAAAPPVSADPNAVPEIVVTALKRSTNLQDTPLAITAVTGATLSAQGVTDSSQLQKVSPGLVITESNFTGSRLTIRNIYAAGEATVGLYYDDTPVPGSAGVNADAGGTTPSLRLFDVDHVEVLRGPQGTLYGSSSMAGTVRLIFNKPNLDKFEGDVAGEVSTVTHGGAIGGQTQGMVNVPIIEDKLAVRIVGFYQHTPGYVDNIALGKSDVNADESEGGRLTIRAKPLPNLTIDGLAVVQETRGALDDYFLALGSYKQNYAAGQPFKDRFQLYSLTGNWDVGPVKLTGVVSHSMRDFTYNYDFSAFFRTFGALYPVGSPIRNALFAQAPSVANSPQSTSTDTAEFRFSSNTHGPFQYTAGFYYSNRQGDFNSNILRTDPISGDPLAVNSTNLLGERVITDKLRQTAGFAEGAYDITSKLSATVGVRYFDYTRADTSRVTVTDALVGLAASPPIIGAATDSGFLYKFNLSYKFTPRIMGYATASSGERPGGVNTTLGLPTNLQTYSSDTLWNYEVGAKSEFFDRRLTLNANGYIIDWDKIQVSGILPNTNFGFIANAGTARVYGSEVEATLRPMAGLQIQGSASYNDAKLTQNESNQTLQAPGQKGDDLPYVPAITTDANVQYGWDLPSDLKALVRADVYYSGFSWTTFPHTNAYQDRLPAYFTFGLRGTLSGPGNWTASLFANNLFDSNAVINKLSSNVFGGLNNVRAIGLVPRTIGIDFTKHF